MELETGDPTEGSDVSDPVFRSARAVGPVRFHKPARQVQPDERDSFEGVESFEQSSREAAR